MKILVIDNNTLNLTKVRKVFTEDKTEISDMNEIQHIRDALKSENEIGLIIINEVIENILNKHLLYKELRMHKKDIPVISLGIA